MKNSETIETNLPEEKVLEVLRASGLDIRKKQNGLVSQYWIMRDNYLRDPYDREEYRLVKEKYFSLDFYSNSLVIEANGMYELWALKAEIMEILGINFNEHHEQKERLTLLTGGKKNG